jgi:hypothetical protein
MGSFGNTPIEVECLQMKREANKREWPNETTATLAFVPISAPAGELMAYRAQAYQVGRSLNARDPVTRNCGFHSAA